MPIIRIHDDPMARFDLAQRAGTAQGQAQAFNAQRGADQRIIEMAVAASQERNRRPGFIERAATRSAIRDAAGTVTRHTKYGDDPQGERDRVLSEFDDLADQKGIDPVMRFAARRELESKGALSSDTVSRLGLPTPQEEAALIRATKAAAGKPQKSEQETALGALPPAEESGARAATLGNWAGAVALSSQKEPDTFGPDGNPIPGAYKPEAAKARTGIIAAMPFQDTDELEAGRAAFQAAGDTEMATAYEAEINRRDSADMLVISEKIAPQEHALVRSLVERIGVPDSPEAQLAWEQQFKAGLEQLCAQYGITLDRYMKLYDKQSGAVYAAANRQLSEAMQPIPPGGDDNQRVRPQPQPQPTPAPVQNPGARRRYGGLE